MKLGFIGLGAMGQPMAQHLLRAGHQLSVWSRRPEAAEPLLAAGATRCAAPEEVARQSRMVFTMLTSGADVEAVALGPRGLIHGCAPGSEHFSILVDMGTSASRTVRRIGAQLAACGVAMLDAPVSGGPSGAQSATLAIMVGGGAEIVARVRPLLELLGTTIVHIGELGAGQVAKACNQMVMVSVLQACAEALRLAAASGVDAARVRAALLGGAAGSRVLEVFGARMVARDFQAGVQARLHHKDFGMLLDEAQQLGCALPLAGGVAQQLNALMGQGWGQQDSAALLHVLELQASPA